MKRRNFLKTVGVGAGAAIIPEALGGAPKGAPARRRPNLVYVFADQWRAQATGYAGDANAVTPNIDRLATGSINLTNAVSCCPVCSPYRASLMTGQYPLTHGVFLNDVYLSAKAVSIAEACAAGGYDTAYIGKWHLDGQHRSAFIPRRRRQGFEYWKVLECTHNYNDSAYYGHENVKLKWKGYDAAAQTRDAQQYIKSHAQGGGGGERPFLLVLSWGPPHNPYHTAPAKFRQMFKDASKLKLRPNVPKARRASARKELAGYYAHCAALDACVGDLLGTLKDRGIEDDTIFVFTSDHGDMLGSQGMSRKQKPWDESIMVPFLLRYPAGCGREGKVIDMPFNAPDIMPTLLGLCGIKAPDTVEGRDYSGVLRGTARPTKDAALITCPSPFGEWRRPRAREYRGVRTRRHTYVRDLKGLWLLYDNRQDPYQMNNLVGKPDHAEVQKKLEAMLAAKLKDTSDEFLSGWDYIKKWGHKVDKNGTVPYTG